MALGGYEKSCGKRSGGIRSLDIVSVNDIVSAEYDHSGNCSGITLKENAEFARYDFREDEAEYTEQIYTDKGVVRVKHTLEFAMERPDGQSAKAVNQLIGECPDGLAAIITTNSNISFLVGYSRKFGAEQPLRLSKSTMDTGRKPADFTAETITLVSEDDSKASVFTGEQ